MTQLYEWNPTCWRYLDTVVVLRYDAHCYVSDPLPAGSTENQLMFSYRVTTNMAGGQVEFSLPDLVVSQKDNYKTGDITDEKVADGA